MNERMKSMALAAVATDSFPKPIPEHCNDPVELSDPVAVAEGMRRFLLKQPVEIRPGELLADRYRYHGCEYPADYYKRAGHNNLSRVWKKCCFSSHPNDLYYWGWTHVSLDYGYILENGLRGYLRRVDEALQKYEGQEKECALLKGMRIALMAIQERSALVASAARRAAEREQDPKYRVNELSIAARMERVPMEPAENFREAVTCVWTMFLTAPDSLGRIDQYLYPFYSRELSAGTLSREEAKEYLQELFVRVHESQVDNKPQPHSGHNHLVVGGYLQNGEDGWNDLSDLILESMAELPTFRPQASFRYTRKTTPEVMRKITEYNHRCPLIVFVNDEPRIEGMVRCGIRREDAIEYTVLGCNEWAICGKSKMDLVHISLMHALKTLLWDRRAEAVAAPDFESLFALLSDCIARDMRRIMEDYAEYAREQAKDVNVLTSALMEDCIENARSFVDGGVRYHGVSLSFNGLPNLADSLSVIREYVYERGQLTLPELLTILDENWAGAEGLRGQILRQAHFFGNDDPYADGIAQRLVLAIDGIREKLTSEYANVIVCGSFVGATHPNIVLGKQLPATPDGRYAGEEMTMGVSQTMGRDRNGVTALLKSIASLDYSRFCGCLVSNLKLDPKMADTPEKMERIAQLFHTFLRLGGMQLQINYVSSEELHRAQEKPENYSNLMVRVTGYSGYFTLFDRDLQNDIIKRTEQKDA